MLGLVDRVAVGAAEPAPQAEFVEVLAIIGQAAADSGDLAVEAPNFPLGTGHDLAHHWEVGLEPLETAQLGTAVGASARVDVGNNLLVKPMECLAILAPIELVPEGLGGGKLGGGAVYDDG